MQGVQLLLVLCLSPLYVLGVPRALRLGDGRGPSPIKAKREAGGPKGPKGMRPGLEEKQGDHILKKMTHMEKIFNFCDLNSVKRAKESYSNDFLIFDKKSKQSCGRLRCTGNGHICCPVTGKFNGTAHTDYYCLNNNEEHRGSCPCEMTHVTHLEYGITKKISESRGHINCRRDRECRLNEKCCLSAEDKYSPWHEARSIECRPAEDIEDSSEADFEEMWNGKDKELPLRNMIKQVLSFLK